MRWVVLAAALWSGAAGAQGVPREVGKGLTAWPEAGGWTTLLLVQNAGRNVVCETASKAARISPTQALFAFTMTPSATHLHISYGGPEAMAGATVRLSGDGVKIADLPVLDQEPSAGNNHLVANLPESMLVDLIAPGLSRSGTMQVDIGDRRFTTRVSDFGSVAKQMEACALRAISLYEAATKHR